MLYKNLFFYLISTIKVQYKHGVAKGVAFIYRKISTSIHFLLGYKRVNIILKCYSIILRLSEIKRWYYFLRKNLHQYFKYCKT